MRASCLRRRRCGAAGRERGSICASSRPRTREAVSPFARLLRERHSIRSFDDGATDHARRAVAVSRRHGACRVALDQPGSTSATPAASVAYAARPYPSAGASYELELYLAVDNCDGLARGFYHYDAGGHALVPIDVRTHELEALLTRSHDLPWTRPRRRKS